jgi:type IV pilus assembly protein PilC
MDTAAAQVTTEIKAPKEVAKETTIKTGLFSGIKILDVIMSIKHLSIMLKSSMALEDAIRALADQAQNKNYKAVWTYILGNIQSGQSLSESLEKFPKVFSKVIVSIIRAGEEGGTLEKNLLYLADYIKKDFELKRKVKGALFYPAFIMAFTAIEMLGFIFIIIPKLEPFFKTVKTVPTFTKIVLSIAHFLQSNILYLVIGVIILGWLFTMFLKTKVGQVYKDKFLLGMPIIKNLIRQSILANFSRTLGILLESGIPITKALSVCSETIGSLRYATILTHIFEDVKSGKNLSESLDQYPNQFPSTFTKLISVGEETATLEDNLLYLHQFYADEVDDMSNNLTIILEPILLVFIGLMIGLMAISLVVPIFQVTSAIN